ncbi:hemopexin repeat-containing protein [Streptomyces sp. NPDC057743]|uniref:hemopexin repeat-containing protein n=1 Tax=Streptomyces sp. NPDC057743 TaxID=3346236 RepID=UPI0036B29F74
MVALTTAIAWPNDKVYLFFDDDTYHRYDAVSGSFEQGALPVNPNWGGPVAGLDGSPGAFVWWGAGKAYALTGGTYVRYDQFADRVDPEFAPPNTPQPLTVGWHGLPDGSDGGPNWQQGIDTAVNWGTGKLYLFKGDAYLRYDITADRVDPGYPLPIAGNWPGVFSQDLTAALYPGGRHAYFFRGDAYQRFDLDADLVDDTGTLSAGFRLAPTPSGALAPARLLTLPQANKLMADLIRRGKLTLKSPAFVDGPTGIVSPTPAQHVSVSPPTLAGIRYTNALNPPADFFDNVDQRMLMALYRLTRWINSSRPDVAELFHLGIGHGNGPPNDCHNQGRALDLSAIAGTLDGTPFNKSIKTDWGDLPPRPGSNIRIDPSVDALAYGLFTTAFRFATFECEANGIGTANKWPMPDLGGSGFVIYPDYGGDPALRASHQNHIHMQVGPTRV